MTEPLAIVREITDLIDAAKAKEMKMTVEALRFALFAAQEDTRRLSRSNPGAAD